MLEAEMVAVKSTLAELQLRQQHLLHDQQEYLKIVRRDIVVRARDLISAEGQQPHDICFYRFAAHLPVSFLAERNLTDTSVAFISGGGVIEDGDAVAHHLPLTELDRGLGGLSGRQLASMTTLLDFVKQRQQDAGAWTSCVADA
jgi:hypothetical protein